MFCVSTTYSYPLVSYCSSLLLFLFFIFKVDACENQVPSDEQIIRFENELAKLCQFSDKYNEDISADTGESVADLFKGKKIYIKDIYLENNTILSQNILSLNTCYRGRYLEFYHVQALIQLLSEFYASLGYINSGVVLKDIDRGVLVLRAIEGRFAGVFISGFSRYQKRDLNAQLGIQRGDLLNVGCVEYRVKQLQNLGFVKNTHTTLSPGKGIGLANLNVSIIENDSRAWGVNVGNPLIPAVGEFAVSTFYQDKNVQGRHDQFGVQGTQSEGYSAFGVDYDKHIFPDRFLASFAYMYSQADIVEEPFDLLSVNSRYTGVE